MRKTALLAAALALALAVQADEGSFDAAQQDQIGKIAAAYIEQHPEVILNAIKKLEAQEQDRHAKLVEETGAAYRDDPDTPAKGPKGPKHYIVDFYDYNCGYCKAMEPIVEQALEDKSLDLRVSYVNLPVIAKTSAISATVAQAIYNVDKEKFFAFHDRLMHDEADPNSVDALKELAKSVGIKWDKVDEEMKSGRPQGKIRNDLAKSRQLQITGTPYLIIDGREYRGAVQSLSDLKAMLSKP
jgi:protein-disulfide isomerase